MKKNIRNFYMKIFIFLVVKFSAYLNRHVLVMPSFDAQRRLCFVVVVFPENPHLYFCFILHVNDLPGRTIKRKYFKMSLLRL